MGLARGACVLFAVLAWPATSAPADDRVILDQSCHLRCYCRFGVNRYSPALLASEGVKTLGKTGWDKLRRETLAKGSNLPAGADWQVHVFQPLYPRFVPVTAPPPPGNWAEPDFDDGRPAWVRQRGPFQGSPPPGITTPNLGQYDEAAMDMGLLHAYYRARFVVDQARGQPSVGVGAGALTLTMSYHGGVRVLLNGQQIAAGHLRAGSGGDAAPAGDDYPKSAYDPGGAAQRLRSLGPVSVPAKLLRAGVNVLALETHASEFHPVVLTNPRQPNWGGPTRPFPHNKLVSFALRTSGAGEGAVGPARGSLARPPGAEGSQVWVEDIHHRVESTDFLPPGESPGTIRMVAPRNGQASAQIVVGTSTPLTDLALTVSDLTLAGGSSTIPSAAVRVMQVLPFPRDQWTLKRLGDERGLAASFPTTAELADCQAMKPGTVYIFDGLRAGAPKGVPADACRPIWLSLRVPESAAAGTYRGQVKVSAAGLAQPASIPVELEVIGWRLPRPADFKTLVGCEQNPYAVASQYRVKPWSAEHFKLLEASLAQLGRIGNTWVNVPVILNSEFGNRDDSAIRWTRAPGGKFTFDYTTLQRYLDLVEKHCGWPRVVQFVVEHGMKGNVNPPPVGQVNVFDAAGGATAMNMDCSSPPAREAWKAFAVGLYAFMKSRGQEKAMHWGAPLEGEADPQLKNVLAAAVPAVFWTAGPHEMMSNGTFAKDERFYRLVTTIRYWGNWPSFRLDSGWKSKTVHLLNPRPGGTVFAMHTTSLPLAYRVLADRCIAFGRSGFTRVGADDWAATHYSGMVLPRWLTGMPVLFVLWPGPDGAESSVRFEMLLEGVQEAEARIAVEQALDGGRATGPLADRLRGKLADNLAQTSFFLGNSIIHAFEQYHYNWQQRSAAVYRAAAEAAGPGGESP